MSIPIALTRQRLRSSLPLGQQLRQISSQSAPLEFSLPPAKLRALITIYHNSSTFVTPENLSATIDQAFIGNTVLFGAPAITEANYDEIHAQLRWRRASPMTGAWKRNEVMHTRSESVTEAHWGGGRRRSGREKKVIAALYGTDGDGRPGLEIVQDEKERFERDREEEKGW